jgi:predicted DNA-binding transcriptional regulator YafY
MRRADRLFQIVQILRNKRLVTARDLAQRLEVSERTIYRDMQDLSLSGVPIEGEVGVGYHLRYSLDIPPLMFTEAEIEALVLGARMLRVWGGAELRVGAQSVLDKVHAVIPAELQTHLQQTKLFVPTYLKTTAIDAILDQCRKAIAQQLVLELHYQRADGQTSHRCVYPLGLFFWGANWTLASWCELRYEFRNFRLDRIQQFKILERQFESQAGQQLADFFASLAAQEC